MTPAAGQSGTATITVTVTDASSGTANDSFVLTVTAASTPTTTSMPSTSLTPSTYGQAVTFTSTVTGAGGTPTGTVEFFDNGISLGVATLSGGSASLMTTAWRPGRGPSPRSIAVTARLLPAPRAARDADREPEGNHLDGDTVEPEAIQRPRTV